MSGGEHPSRAEIKAGQLEELRSLLAELFPANRFYTRKLHDCGITFDVASLEDFSARFPFTSKSELVQNQQANPPFGTNLTYSPDRYTRFHQTSGTTGSPMRWLDTDESWQWMVESWVELYRAAGVGPNDRIYFAFSFGPFIGFWIAFEAGVRAGALCIPGGGMSSAARIAAVLDNGATVLCCTPTYAIRLAEVAAAEGADIAGRSKVRLIITAGEMGGSVPAVRRRLEELWPGARVFDHHGMTEVGPVTYECPMRPGVLHVMESAYYAEVINPVDGQAVAPGETGELVLTTLGRLGSPLLRYRTGDLVRAETAPCLCGRNTMTLPGGILGRADDMVVVRGVNVFPAAVDEVIRAECGLREYRVIVSAKQALTELTVEVECESGAEAEALAAKLEKSFQVKFALRVAIKVVPPGSLPRFEMKSKRWVKEQLLHLPDQ
jgi:phenylacetate-CoA ligase